MSKLSIVIPTYNRPSQLIKTLHRLVDQCRRSYVKILIIDNASPHPVTEIIAANFSKFDDVISVVRNSTNVGGNANICKCYELCETPWMWLLGDDDDPYQNAIEIILQQIQEVPDECAYICFSTNRCQFLETSISSQEENFWDYVERHQALNNMSFISSGVYRADLAKLKMIQAYHAISTSFPQLVMIRSLCLNENTIVLSKEIACDWLMADENQHWCHTSVMAGIPALISIEGFGRRSTKCLSSLFEACRPRPFSKWVMERSSDEKGEGAEYFLHLFLNLLSIARGKYFFSCMKGVILCKLFLVFPSIRRFFANRIIS